MVGIIVNPHKPIQGQVIDPLYEGFELNVAPVERSSTASWVMLGPSGAGKEDRGTIVQRTFNLESKLQSGDIFRNKVVGPLSIPEINFLKGHGSALLAQGNDTFVKFARSVDTVAHFFGENRIRFPDGKKENAAAAYQTLNGLFVSDDVYLPLVDQQFHDAYINRKTDHGIVLDGHIRTGNQVDSILRFAHQFEYSVGSVLLVHTPLAVLLERTVGRLQCKEKNCGRKYNATAPIGDSRRPFNVYENEDGLLEGYCREHQDTLLSRRDDDYPDKVKNRLNEYKENIRGVLSALSANNIPVYVVSGNLANYDDMPQSMQDTFDAKNNAVLRYF